MIENGGAMVMGRRGFLATAGAAVVAVQIGLIIGRDISAEKAVALYETFRISMDSLKS